MPDKSEEATRSPKEIIESEVEEYQSWAQGDVWSYIIEKRETWVPENRDESDSREMSTWNMEDSCSGLIGYEYAREEATRAFSNFVSG